MALEIPTIKYGDVLAGTVKVAQAAGAIFTEIEKQVTPPPVPEGFKPTVLAKGKFVGEQWVQEDGYVVDKKWVAKYPSLFGPMRQDPDLGYGQVEADDVLAKISAKFTGFGGTFSTWTERHAFLIFAGIGFNDVTTSADVPPIPDFFVGEMAYCYSGLTMGRAAKKLDDAGGIKKVASLIVAGAALGNIPRLYGLLTSGAI